MLVKLAAGSFIISGVPSDFYCKTKRWTLFLKEKAVQVLLKASKNSFKFSFPPYIVVSLSQPTR
jgi:hypothetical protein